jgi:hypothetical protein
VSFEKNKYFAEYRQGKANRRETAESRQRRANSRNIREA